MYYNYHARAHKLIDEGHMTHCEIVGNWNGIKPALVLYFDNHRPMPIRKYRWEEYLKPYEILEIFDLDQCVTEKLEWRAI